MAIKSRRSIGRRIVITLACVVCVCLGALTLLLTELQKASLLSAAEHANLSVGELLSQQLSSAIKFKQGSAIEATLQDLASRPGSALATVHVLNAAGEPLAAFQSETFAAFDFTESLAAHLAQVTDEQETSQIVGRDFKALIFPINFGPKNEFVGTLALAWTTAPTYAGVFRANLTGAAVSLATLAVIVTLIIVLMRRLVLRPLTDMTQVMTALAAGRNDVEIPYKDREDEIGAMGRALSVFKENAKWLDDLIAELTETGSHVGAASHKILGSASEISEKLSAQALELQRTSAAMEQMAASVRANSESAIGANALTENAAKVVLSGHARIDEAVSSVEGVVEKTGQISTIVSTINNIARQTNLLSINAGIEAARAGEAGKGFAVVAAEVGRLSHNSATAVSGIEELVSETVASVEDSMNVVSHLRSEFGQIQAAISEISQKVESISIACSEQSKAATEVAASARGMDALMQGNAEHARKSVSEAEALASRSSGLSSLLESFESRTNTASA